MFAKHESVSDIKDSVEGEEIAEGDVEYEGKCFMETTSKSSITDKARTLLISFNIPSNSYDYVLSGIYDSYGYLNNILISLSSDVEKAHT